ncbi:hypothetical protein EDB19DRAFT_292261 [Suillus lakei]|nr:hypothetical protein EDB19DRAFT_292261 [Suillus lakei]
MEAFDLVFVFLNSGHFRVGFQSAGESEYDHFWRMPLDEDYGPQIYFPTLTCATSTGEKPAGSCTAALFLKAFIDGIEAKDGQEPSVRWAHLDTAGTMEFTCPTGNYPRVETLSSEGGFRQM